MKLIHAPSEIQTLGRKVSVAIGVFDGVHLGHQQVIRQALADAHQHEGIAIVITFDCHPNAVVAPAHVPPLIYSLPQKLRVIASLGVETTWLIHFDRPFSEQSAETFIRNLAGNFAPVHSICVGNAFTFGHRRQGNVALLRELGRELHLIVHGLAAVSLDGEIVSSTRIREAIRAGDLDLASQMLGREYSLTAKVVRGDGLGRQLGFPTANLDVTGLVLPPHGVYAAHVRIDGAVHRAVLNIGIRPTVAQQNPQVRFEVHLLDFEADLYDQEIEVIYVEKLRDEKKFSSPAALREQIERDIAAARQLF